MKQWILFIGCILSITLCRAQVKFQSNAVAGYDYPSQLGISPRSFSMDMNDDGFTDVLQINQNEATITILYSGRLGIESSEVFNITTSGKVLSALAANIDNDRDIEVVVFSLNKLFQVYDRKDGIYGLDTLYSDLDVYVQGTNFVDVNSDGYLDIFICNDVGLNQFYLNNGNGRFTKSTVIDFGPDIRKEQEGNYGSIWSDIDGDNDLDLLLAKCSVYADTSTDVRRINRLYLNEDGAFREVGAERGFADGAQSWSIDSGDVDNDGDIDIFYTNHGSPHVLMLNEEGSFIPSSQDFGTGTSLQSYLYDFDNNGYLDVLIVETEATWLWFNIDGSQFKKERLFFDRKNPDAVIPLDINTDGKLDLIGTSVTLDSMNALATVDILLMNQSMGHHSMVIDLDDDLVIGNKITVYAGEDRYTREIKAGYSYCVTPSTQVHFGLGKHTQVDSVTVTWRDAQYTTMYGLSADRHYSIARNGCMKHRALRADRPLYCGDTLLLSASYENVLWNTGQTTQDIDVSSEGIYRYIYQDTSGCDQWSDDIIVQHKDAYIEEYLAGDRSWVFCEGDSLLITVGDEAVVWDDAVILDTLLVTRDTDYFPVLQEACTRDTLGRYTMMVDTMELPAVPDSLDLIKDRPVNLWSTYPNVEWFTMEGMLMDSTELQSYSVDKDTQLQCKAIQQSPEINMRRSLLSWSAELSIIEENLVTYLYVNEPLIIDSISVYAAVDGMRKLVIRDEGKTILFEGVRQLNEGWNTISVGMYLGRGKEYSLYFDKNFNVSSLGTEHPGLIGDEAIWKSGSHSAPLISRGHDGRIIYDIFYHRYNDPCEADAKTVYINAITEDGVNDYVNDITFYPNPNTSGKFTVSEPQHISKINVFNMDGRLLSAQFDGAVLEISSPGFYIVVVHTAYGTQIEKLWVLP